MEKKCFAYVGSWSKDGQGGIGIYQYNPQSGGLKLLNIVEENISAGFTLLDEKRNVLYVADERKESPEYGAASGGRILAYRIDPETGALVEISRQSSLGVLPASLSWDGAGDGILICNHSSDTCIYQVTVSESGEIGRKRVYNDTPVAHYPILADGSIGAPDAVLVTPNQESAYSCLHAVSLAPDGHTLLVCERNQDILYRLAWDAQARELKITDTLELRHGNGTKDGDCPRYIAWHPTLPLVYVNSEYHPLIFVIRYTGAHMELVGRYEVTPPGKEKEIFSQSDLCVSADGRYLYNLYRGINMVGVHRLDEKTGAPEMIQSVQLEGEGPRGCCLAPDGSFLLVANLVSGDVTSLPVRTDGTLDPRAFRATGQTLPGNVRIYGAG